MEKLTAEAGKTLLRQADDILVDWEISGNGRIGRGAELLIPRAGDRDRTGDVQLGKLAFYR